MPHQTNITHLLFKSTQSTCHNPLYVHKWHKSTHSSQPLSLQNYHFDCSPHGKAALPFPHRAWQPTIRKFIFIIILECDTRSNTGSLPTSESDHTADRGPGQDHHFLFPPTSTMDGGSLSPIGRAPESTYTCRLPTGSLLFRETRLCTKEIHRKYFSETHAIYVNQ